MSPLLVPLATLQSATSSQPSAQALALPAAPSAWPRGVILDERLGAGWRGPWTIQVMPHFTEEETEAPVLTLLTVVSWPLA